MNKVWNTPLSFAASLAIATAGFAGAALAADQQSSSIGYVKDAAGQTVRSGFGTCVRAGYWTPAMATQECDADLLPKPAPKPAPAKPAAKPEAKPAAKPEAKPAAKPEAKPAAKPAAAPVTQKVTLAADVLFDFDKAVVKPEGRTKLDDLVGKMKAINLEVIIAIGHTDSIGSDAYNQKLSMRRATAVKDYLVSKGIAANRIYTEGKGEKQPVASNSTKDGRAKNRRVDLEVVGTTVKPAAAKPEAAKPEAAKPAAKPAAR
jgi:OOP family OmpA-OmpF porin